MKLLQELLSLVKEEAIETKAAEDLWKDSKDSIKTYITNTVYYAKEIEGSDPTRYEVYKDVNDKRKLVKRMDGDKFDELYEPVRANQSEDAEGYKTYRDIGDLEAFKYDGDSVKVDLEGQTGLLKNGDYLIRKTEGDNYVYSIETGKHFEADYTEEK